MEPGLESSTQHLDKDAHLSLYPFVPGQSLQESPSCVPAQAAQPPAMEGLWPQQDQVKEEQCFSLLLTLAV